MANMDYCRFRNTLGDLLDCMDHMDERLDDEEELKARDEIIHLCIWVAENYGFLG